MVFKVYCYKDTSVVNGVIYYKGSYYTAEYYNPEGTLSKHVLSVYHSGQCIYFKDTMFHQHFLTVKEMREDKLRRIINV